MEFPVNETEYEFLRKKHIKYCIRCLGILPERCESIDSTRQSLCTAIALPTTLKELKECINAAKENIDRNLLLYLGVWDAPKTWIVAAFFAVSSLDHLNALDKIENEKQNLINWIYSLQVTPSDKDTNAIDYGFRGSSTCMAGDNTNSDLCDKAHIAMTYTALSTLIVLGDDLSKVDRENIIYSLKDLQLPNGSFRPMNFDCESDMRFVYCAASVCYILQDWSSIDIEKTIEYIKKSRNYDGGIGQGPGLESHGGSTYCAVATLWLMGELKNTFSEKELNNMKRWLVFRQHHGFHGRPNKPDDTCYSFWIGATLKILDCYEFVNYQEVSKYVFSAQDDIIGGIAKWVDYGPDTLHTYLGISGLLLYDKGSPLIHPALNVSQRAADFLCKIQNQWKMQS